MSDLNRIAGFSGDMRAWRRKLRGSPEPGFDDPRTAARVAGRDTEPENFANMLQARPGAYLFLGPGDSAGLHHPAHDFNDEAAPGGRFVLCAPRGRGATAGCRLRGDANGIGRREKSGRSGFYARGSERPVL